MIANIWCECCQDWKSEFIVDQFWILCADCNEGLVKMTKDDRKQIAKQIWRL
jgi:Zn finger protein HypA/HybF involved in hydrogenase expression